MCGQPLLVRASSSGANLLLLSRHLLAWVLAVGRCVLDLGVQFCADQNRKSRDVEPQEEDDDAADGAVRGVVVSKVRDVKLEEQRDDHPEQRPDNGTRGDPDPVLLGIRGEVVDQANGAGHEEEGQRPLQNLPRPLEDRAEAERRREAFREGGTRDDQRERGQDEYRQCDR